MKQEWNTQSKFIFINFIIVILLGVKTFDSLFVDTYIHNEPIQSISDQLRNPASISPKHLIAAKSETLKSTQIQQEAITISMNCQKNKKVVTQSEMVMLRGNYCFKDLKGEEVKMINLKNGFEASFFALDKNQFNTDLIQLASGLNEIEIQVIKNQQIIYVEKIQIESQSKNRVD